MDRRYVPAYAASPMAAEDRPVVQTREAPVKGAEGAAAFSERPFIIPSGYGIDRIVLMVKDPWWLFAYWEIQSSTERVARGQLLPNEIAGLQTVLRVYDVTGVNFPKQPSNASWDVNLSGLATYWYLPVEEPSRSFVVDIAILAKTGRFITLARSNRVMTPRAEPSPVIDPEWAVSDAQFRKLAGELPVKATSGSVGGRAPGVPQPRLLGGSPASASNLTGQQPVRGFWCRVETDLILYGATEPRAKVFIQGQPAQVRADGTFSLRVALPEGTKTITVDVVSPDGKQTRTVTPVITRASAVVQAEKPPVGSEARKPDGTDGA